MKAILPHTARKLVKNPIGRDVSVLFFSFSILRERERELSILVLFHKFIFSF